MPITASEPLAAFEEADLDACAALLREGSKSFDAAARLLPARVARPATALYAFCRIADDAVDCQPERLAALERLRERLEHCYAGRPEPHPADRAFARTIAAHGIPRALPEALLEGLAWDAQGRRYDSLSDLTAYAARVAATVGGMMTLVMGRRDPAVLARACDLGVAMQFTNIARDVGEDARAGRLYLPLAWLREAGIDAGAFLADPRPSPELASVIRRLLAVSDGLYARATGGIAGLPLSCRGGIAAARLIYAEIGRDVARRGCDSVTGRAAVSGRRKAALAARALLGAPLLTAAPDAPPLAETRFIVDAAMASAAPAREPGALLRLLMLFERLERIERGFANG